MATRWSQGSRRWVVLAGLVLVAGAASAHEVRGTIAGADGLSPSPRAVPPRWRGSYWEVPNGALAITAPRASVERDVAVVLTGASVAEARQPVTVSVQGGRCLPGTVVLSPGTTLTLDNQDMLAHEFFVVRQGQDERVVAAEMTASRARRQVSLPAAGTYELRDARQPSFRCWVVAGAGQGRVLLVNSAGAFAATGLEDGTYTVKAYFEGVERASADVTVAGREAAVTLTLAPAAGAAAPAAAAPTDDDRRRRR